MSKVKTYDFRAFVSTGELVRTDKKQETRVRPVYAAGAGTAVAAMSIDHAFDPIIQMLQQMSFPVCSIVLAWACLRAMTGHPAAAVDQAKWAILGYIAMRYAPGLLRGLY